MANTADPIHGFTITNPLPPTTNTTDGLNASSRGHSELNLENLSLLSSSAPTASSHTRRSSAWVEGVSSRSPSNNEQYRHERAPSRASIHSLPSEILHDALSHLIPPTSTSANLPAYIPSLSTPTNPPTDTAIPALSLTDPDPQTTTFLDPSPNASPADLRLRHLLAVSRVNKAFHETAKKLLWEEVDVTGGRGWISIVDALMEEVDESGGEDENGPMAMAIDIPSSTLHIDTHMLPLPVGELAFSTATPISPTSSLISSDFAGSYIAHSQSQAEAAIAEATCSTSIQPQNLNAMSLHHVVSLLTPVQSRLSSTSSRRRRLQSRSRSTSQHARSRSPSFGGISVPPPRPRLDSLGRQASARGRQEDQSASRGIDAVLAEEEDRRSRSASSRRVRITSPDGRDGGDRRRQHSHLEEEDEDEDVERQRLEEEEEEERGRSGWSPRSVAETLFDSPHAARGTLEEDEDELEARHRLEDWEISSCQWEAPRQTITPGQYIRHLSFANFRTTGTRRTQEEAVRGKFVTGGRLEGVLKNTPNLRTLGMTEYVDSALTLPVLTELFFRGYTRPSYTFTPESSFPPRRTEDEENNPNEDRHIAVGRQPVHTLEYVPYEPETDEEQWDRRENFAPLEALDLTGCVSRVFGESLEAFVQGWLVEPPTDGGAEEEERGRSRVAIWDQDSDAGFNNSLGWRKPRFDRLKRLSLRACTTIPGPTICTLVSSFPNLTHLDLSVTRVTSSLLEALTNIPTLQLKAFSIARCTRVSSEAIRDFLINAPGARTIIDLNLFGDFTYTSPLTLEDLDAIVRDAPCFKNRQLRYLDLSSAPVTNELLSKAVFPPQPHLRSLGLSYIPTLDLGAVAEFLTSQAPNVEILTIASSSTLTDLPNLTALETTMVLHSKLINPLTLPPFSLFRQPGATAPTKLRVIELSTRVRNLLGLTGGSKDWRTIKSKGNRGWYVDTSAGWIDLPGGLRTFTRGLTRDQPSRKYLEQLAEYNGRVGSGVGWHSRKMEVIRGDGMMGREAGLYGAGAFAFEG